MKILHLLSSNRYSGAENVACQIISLFKKEYDVAYCSPDGQISEALRDRNIKFIPLEKMSKRAVAKAIKEFQPDIVHAHDPRAICMACRVRGKFRIIAHMHSNRPDFKRKSLFARIFNHFSNNKRIRKIVWVSNSCLEEYVFKKQVEEKSVVLNNIINQQQIIDKAKIAEKKDQSDIVFLGRLTYPKNPQRLIHIIGDVAKIKPNINVAIIGDGELREECEQLTKELNLEKNIKFYGFLDNPFGLLKNSKIFLLSSRFEGNPMCVLEAETFGLPVLAPEINELKTTVIEGVSGFLYKTDEECVDRVIELLKNPEKAKKLSQTTYEFSQQYNNMAIYKQKIDAAYN